MSPQTSKRIYRTFALNGRTNKPEVFRWFHTDEKIKVSFQFTRSICFLYLRQTSNESELTKQNLRTANILTNNNTINGELLRRLTRTSPFDT